MTIRPYETSDRVSLLRLWTGAFPDDPPWNAPDLMIENKLKVQPELLLVAIVDNAVAGAVMGGTTA